MPYSKRRILIIEDDVDIRELYEVAFRPLNVEIYNAGNANDALAKLEAAPLPDAIILDFSVPGMPTEDFHVRLKKSLEGSSTKLLMISGIDGLAERAAELGAWGFLRKPFDLDELLATVRKLS